jgi:putative PIN family toxin of toxin-antitoxin system
LPSRRNTRPGLADGQLVRAVVDVNVLISGVLSAKGASAEILRANRDGQLELVVSELLLAELERTLAYPRLRKRIPPEKAAAFLNWVRHHGTMTEDPISPPPVGSRDPDDDCLLALAIDRRAYLVTGDQDLLVLNDELPILTTTQFASKLRDTR